MPSESCYLKILNISFHATPQRTKLRPILPQNFFTVNDSLSLARELLLVPNNEALVMSAAM